ncbi:uncharacterized protein BYT42DRAFT_573531 [Radiomyces spectabilis]|uniref:uncharacterized protein n=1 Tax=Radiomyces spectabilis TaxID=64574 RepID=UPI00221F9135|nr:uncharacterized protein BYT42DRAFT_573531 [Radiomyces spectabilis]KAI8376133.1 hypothetical protein BYT42DRAFT_573531 [Radiomyces spectabilis]
MRRVCHSSVRWTCQRGYQTQANVSAAPKRSLFPWLAGTVAAAGGGYWLGTSNLQQPVATPTTEQIQQLGQSSLKEPTVPSHTTIQQAFRKLQAVLPPEHVTVDQDILNQHGYSNNSYHNEGAPNIVVFPRSTEEVAAIVKIANELSLPIIPFSGGTSLEGHFSAPRGGICISFTEHMDHIVAFHPEDMDIVVQPGIGWEDLNAELKKHGLFFPLDPGPGACIGGMVGTGCSGTNAVRWGTMREWVLNLTVVLPNGQIIKTRQRPRKSSAGYDLTRLMIGSEGTLGIVTEATLKLAVIPPEETVAVCDFPSVRDAAAVVPDLIRAGVQIGAVELLDELMMKAVNLANPSLGHKERPTLFLKFSGSKPQIEHEIELVSKIVKDHQGGTFRYAKNDHEKADLWEGRKICLWSSTLLKENASIWTTDVVVPVSKLPELIDETKKDLATSSLPAPMVGHVGDGNFHVFILFDKSKPEEYAEAKRLNKNLLTRAIRMEGSVTGEHGVGYGKKEYLPAELGEGTVELMRTVKRAIDPKNIMNPGKVLP